MQDIQKKLDETAELINYIETITDDYEQWAYNACPEEQLTVEELAHAAVKFLPQAPLPTHFYRFFNKTLKEKTLPRLFHNTVC